MTHRIRPGTLGLAALLLSGCATEALKDAPTRPDQPWQPGISRTGEIVSGHPGKRGLFLPKGYTLPSDTTLTARTQLAQLAAGHEYSLADLIDIAQSANPSTRRAWNAAKDAALATGIARSLYLPHLTASVVGGYSHSNGTNSTPTISNGGVIGDEINNAASQNNLLSSGTRNSNSGRGEVQTLGMEWLLFDFGKREAVLEAAKQGALATDIVFTGVHQKVIYAVTTAFYMHAAAEARVALIKKTLENARAVEVAAQARLHHGQGTIVDVTQAQQSTAQAELRLVQAQGSAENTGLDLMNAVGAAPLTHLQTQDVSGRPLALSDIRLTESMIHQAVSRRPDVLAAYAAAKASQSRVRAARAEFLPKIFVSGNVAYSTGHLALSSVPGVGSDSAPTLNLASNRFSSLILGGISVPIFDGGMRAAMLRQAENQSDSAEATLQETQDNSVRQIVAAENGLRSSLSAYEASQKLHIAAQTGFDAALAAYRNGEGSVTQATIIENGLLDARLAQSDAYYAALIAAASLAFATGSLDTSTAPG